MKKATLQQFKGPEVPVKDALGEILKQGAEKLLAQAIEAEVAEYINAHTGHIDDQGHRLVVRNGSMPERQLDTGVGKIKVRQPRVNDHRVDEDGQRMRFTSTILPPYLRRTQSIEDLIPWLYLKGVSTGDFSEFMGKLLGTQMGSLSPTTVVRLKEIWQKEFDAWNQRSLADKRYVYFWVDGIHFNIRLEGERQCILVVMGATEDGRKELVAVMDGYRESEQSWTEVLLSLKDRGLKFAPKAAVGDGALGFWKAISKVFPETRHLRCWVHKTGNVLNKLPKSKHGQAKDDLQQIWMAETKEEAEKAFSLFERKYEAKYPKAVECLTKDRDELLAFYDFPAEHWIHLRTTNPIESTFATVRLRTKRTKGSGSRVACLTMVFKLVKAAESRWRCLNGSKLIQDVIRGVQFKDGIKVNAA